MYGFYIQTIIVNKSIKKYKYVQNYKALFITIYHKVVVAKTTATLSPVAGKSVFLNNT